MCFEESCDRCEPDHRQCECYRADSMVDQLVAKRKKITAEVEKTIKTMEKVYDEAIERLSEDKEQL